MSATTARLVRPSVAFRESFLGAVRERPLEGHYFESRLAASEAGRQAADFAAFVTDLIDRERPVVALGRVPEAFYWLVDGDEYIGMTSFRDFAPIDPGLREVGHIGYDIRPSRQGQGYGTAILGAMLAQMRERSVGLVFVNCDADNVPSRRVIEHWGGVYVESINVPGRAVPRRRYRIDLP